MELFWIMLVMGCCFLFGIVSCELRKSYFPAQNVSDGQEIKWSKPTNLNGSYCMWVVIFPSNPFQEGSVTLSVEKGGTSRDYNFSFNRDFPAFLIYQEIPLQPDDKLKLFFSSKHAILRIKNEPRSYIHLTGSCQSIGQTEIPDTTVGLSGKDVAGEKSIGQTEIPDTTVGLNGKDVAGEENNGSSMKKNTINNFTCVICVILCKLLLREN